MRNDQAIQYFHHMARCDVLGARPLTWAQFCRIACQIEAEDEWCLSILDKTGD